MSTHTGSYRKHGRVNCRAWENLRALGTVSADTGSRAVHHYKHHQWCRWDAHGNDTRDIQQCGMPTRSHMHDKYMKDTVPPFPQVACMPHQQPGGTCRMCPWCCKCLHRSKHIGRPCRRYWRKSTKQHCLATHMTAGKLLVPATHATIDTHATVHLQLAIDVVACKFFEENTIKKTCGKIMLS